MSSVSMPSNGSSLSDSVIVSGSSSGVGSGSGSGSGVGSGVGSGTSFVWS